MATWGTPDPDVVKKNRGVTAEDMANTVRQGDSKNSKVSESRGQMVMRQAGNFAQTYADEALMGMGRPIMAGGKGLFNLATGVDEPFATAYEEADASFDEAREELGTAGGIATDVVSAFTPGGLAGRVDKFLDGTVDLARQLAPAPGDALKRVGKAGVSAGTTSSAQSYLQGDTELETLLLTGALGGMFGAGTQKLMGDNINPMITQLGQQRLGKPALGDALSEMSDTGFDLSKFNLNTLAKAVDEGIPHGQGLLNTKIGDSPAHENWRKLNNYIAKITFGSTQPKDYNTPEAAAARAEWERTQATVDGYAQQVNQDAADAYRGAVGTEKSRTEALEKSTSMLDGARTIMARMSNMKPIEKRPDDYGPADIPLGAQTINIPGMLDRIEGALPDQYNRTSMKYTPQEARKMYGKFNDLVRGVDQESTARDFINIPSEGKNAARADEIFPDDLPLAVLMDARRTFSGALSPAMAFKNGTSPSELAAGVKILRMVDEEIDKWTNGAAGLARGQFAEAKSMEEALDYGKKFYTQRKGEFDNKETFSGAYGDTLDDALDNMKSPKVREAFLTGMMNGFEDNVGKRGFMVEMHNLLGVSGAKLEGDFYNTKTAGLKTFRTMFGDDADTLLKLYNEGKATSKNTKALAENLRAKGRFPDEVTEIIENAGSAVVVDRTKPAIYTEQLEPVVKWFLNPSDKSKSRAATMLMTADGEDLERLLRLGVEQAAGGFPRNVGVRATAAMNVAQDEMNVNESLLNMLGRDDPEGAEEYISGQ